jgi:restriction system protein
MLSVAGLDFEHYVAEIFHLNGHHAAVTKASGDYGVDLILNGKIAVQVKEYAAPSGRKQCKKSSPA